MRINNTLKTTNKLLSEIRPRRVLFLTGDTSINYIIRINDSGIALNLLKWVIKNTIGKVYITYGMVGFECETEAMMFMLSFNYTSHYTL